MTQILCSGCDSSHDHRDCPNADYLNNSKGQPMFKIYWTVGRRFMASSYATREDAYNSEAYQSYTLKGFDLEIVEVN